MKKGILLSLYTTILEWIQSINCFKTLYDFVLFLISELYYDRGNHHEFTSLVKELARPGELSQNTSYDFEFCQVEKPYESYTGANVRLRYVKLLAASNFIFYRQIWTVEPSLLIV